MPPQKTVLIMEAPVFMLNFFSDSCIPENMVTETYNYCTPEDRK